LRAIGIIGYKDSGKTNLACALARELTARGHEVGVIKHSSHRLDLPGKDTALLEEVADQVGFTSPQESAVFWKKPLSLENITPYLEADFLLIEGFKEERTFPKIVCLSGQPEDRDLFDGLAICAVGSTHRAAEIDVPFLSRDKIGDIADLVEEKAFKLPNLDCGGCGHERCYDLARDIVGGRASAEDCISLQPTTEVKIDGQPMPMNPFISGIVRSTILGVLSPLKGFKKGKIEISI
jgi:molybdopterin-guanine dinucleotide biosynthesis protein B